MVILKLIVDYANVIKKVCLELWLWHSVVLSRTDLTITWNCKKVIFGFSCEVVVYVFFLIFIFYPAPCIAQSCQRGHVRRGTSDPGTDKRVRWSDGYFVTYQDRWCSGWNCYLQCCSSQRLSHTWMCDSIMCNHLQGDCRTYSYVAALSSDQEPNWKHLSQLARLIPKVCHNINR